MTRSWWRRAGWPIVGMFVVAGMWLDVAEQPWQWTVAGFCLGCAFMAVLVEWADRRG